MADGNGRSTLLTSDIINIQKCGLITAVIVKDACRKLAIN